jgi:hypothetical protein
MVDDSSSNIDDEWEVPIRYPNGHDIASFNPEKYDHVMELGTKELPDLIIDARDPALGGMRNTDPFVPLVEENVLRLQSGHKVFQLNPEDAMKVDDTESEMSVSDISELSSPSTITEQSVPADNGHNDMHQDHADNESLSTVVTEVTEVCDDNLDAGEDFGTLPNRIVERLRLNIVPINTSVRKAMSDHIRSIARLPVLQLARGGSHRLMREFGLRYINNIIWLQCLSWQENVIILQSLPLSIVDTTLLGGMQTFSIKRDDASVVPVKTHARS